jgi:ribonucleotide reductase beta subunit family protein with ferritin-like domain
MLVKDKEILQVIATFCDKQIEFKNDKIEIIDCNRIRFENIKKLKHEYGELVDLFCVGVPGKAFFIRKNGKISVTGNTMHCDNMIKLFRAYIEENRHIWKDKLKSEIYSMATKIVELEDNFIDLAFKMGPMKNLTADEVKQYIRYICDRRLISLGLKGIFKIKKNPLPWVEYMINVKTHGNFFESNNTDYSKGALEGSWGDVWK